MPICEESLGKLYCPHGCSVGKSRIHEDGNRCYYNSVKTGGEEVAGLGRYRHPTEGIV